MENRSYCRAMCIVSILIFFSFCSCPHLLILLFCHFPLLLSLTLHISPPLTCFPFASEFSQPIKPIICFTKTSSQFLLPVLRCSLPSFSLHNTLPPHTSFPLHLLPPPSFPFFQETITEASGFLNEALGGLAF